MEDRSWRIRGLNPAIWLADRLISMVTAICDGSVGRPDGFADSGSLLIEPFKKIMHCHWLIFSTDSQREVFVNTALVFTSECLLFRSSNVYYLYEWFLPAISGNIFDNVQFAIAANDLESLYNVCIRSLKRISMPHGRILLTSYWAAPSTTQAEASLEILAQRATARERRQSLHCKKVDKFMVL
jgi:hypothetical protein